MLRIVSRFYTACAAPTRRMRRTLCTVCLGGAVLLMVAGLRLLDPLQHATVLLALCGASFVLLVVSLRLALNDVRDVRESYRRSRRELFVTTFSEEEFRRKVREKLAKVREKRARLRESEATEQ
jgi:choline-glycine betaine transporter